MKTRVLRKSTIQSFVAYLHHFFYSFVEMWLVTRLFEILESRNGSQKTKKKAKKDACLEVRHVFHQVKEMTDFVWCCCYMSCDVHVTKGISSLRINKYVEKKMVY